MKPLPKINDRNHLIDVLRLLAASWVALFHFNTPVPHIDNWYRSFTGVGYLGVPVFFVISGYCIQIAINHAETAYGFIVRRLARVFIPYWCSLFIVLATAVIIKLIYGVNFVATFPTSLADIAATFTLLTKPVSTVPTINWIYWTLSYEVFFYAIVAIGLRISFRYNLVWILLITVLSIVLPKHDFWLLFFVQYWPNFCLGMVVYCFLNKRSEYTSLNIILLSLTLISFYYSRQDHYYILVSLITSLLIAFNHIKPFKNDFLARLGNYSYSIYLLHGPIGGYLLGFVKNTKLVQTNIWLNLGWDLLLLSFVVFVARLSWQYIELPAISLGKKLTSNTNNG